MTQPAEPIVAPPVCHYCGPTCPVPFGHCHCGCGEVTKLCPQDSPRDKWIKGHPMRYRRGHHKRKDWASRFRKLPERPVGIPDGVCWCGCGKPTKKASQSWPHLGVLKGEYHRFCKNHFPYCDVPEYVEEMRSEVLTITTPCWIWQRAINKPGYGAVHRREEGKSRLAHQMMYERHKGPVPEGCILDHLCRVRSCVNPDHLEPVTHKVNCRRGIQSKLTMELALEIRRRRRNGEKRTALAKEFGVSADTIYHIAKGDTWA
jgi:HNH endonuclease